MAIRALRTPTRERSQPAAQGEAKEGVGEQLRELRRAKGMTLTEVASEAGISVGYLSQIERNQSRLPIGVLRRISDVLGIHINYFFQREAGGRADERDIVVRAANRRRMTFTGLGISEELLTPNLKGPLEMLMSTIEPGADSEDYSHDGAEAGLVITGTLDLWVAGRRFRLQAGDSFAFASNEVHRCANPGRVRTQVVWVITPPHY